MYPVFNKPFYKYADPISRIFGAVKNDYQVPGSPNKNCIGGDWSRADLHLPTGRGFYSVDMGRKRVKKISRDFTSKKKGMCQAH